MKIVQVSSRTSALEFHYTKKVLDEFITKDSRVIEIGCATGHYALHFSDKCKKYVGIDLFPEHIEIFNKKIILNNLKNVCCQVGDAVKLEGIADNSFDVVCCLGPMYHLPMAERKLVFSECKRICKHGGVIALSYINKIGVYVGGCIYDCEKYPNEIANEFVLKQGTDDLRPGIFYYSTPEEMEEIAHEYGLSKISNTGTDFFITKKIVEQMSDEKFEMFMQLLDEMTKYESCTGMSDHALLVCKKQ